MKTVRVSVLASAMLARRTTVIPWPVAAGLLALSAAACADADAEAHSCNALVVEGTYDIQYDELSSDCLGPLQSILPDQLIRSELLTIIQSARSWTMSESKWGCTANIEILKYDLDNAARIIVHGDDLLETAGAVRGEVTIDLSRIENAADVKPSGGDLQAATTTPLCTTQARATLTLAEPAAGESD